MTNSFIPTAGHVVFQDNIGRNGDYDPGNVKALIAPEIDWCGVNGINTSDQLLELINDIQNEIYTLTAAVIALANK